MKFLSKIVLGLSFFSSHVFATGPNKLNDNDLMSHLLAQGKDAKIQLNTNLIIPSMSEGAVIRNGKLEYYYSDPNRFTEIDKGSFCSLQFKKPTFDERIKKASKTKYSIVGTTERSPSMEFVRLKLPYSKTFEAFYCYTSDNTFTIGRMKQILGTLFKLIYRNPIDIILDDSEDET